MVYYTLMKNFAVTYRDKDGKQGVIQVAAEDRAEVFAELEKRGIFAIRVEEAKGKAKPRKPAPVAKASVRLGLAKGLATGLVVAAAAIGVFWFLTKNKAPATDEPVTQKPAKIVQATPAPAATVEKPKQEKPIDPKEDYDHEKLYRDKAGVLRYKNGNARAYDSTRPKTVVKLNTDPAIKKSIFTNRAENEIERFLTVRPGQTLFGTRRYDKYFENEFKKSLETPIIISEDDSPYVKEVKQAMIDAKLEICGRMRNGETLASILEETRSELTRLAQYKRNLQHEIMKATENPEFTEQDLEDYISAANKMLETKGIAPIKGGAILRKGIILRQKGLTK